MFAYTSRMRCFGQSTSISTVYQASSPLRSQLRPSQRNRFFATCWLMVLAPRIGRPRALFCSALSMASRSKPACSGNRWSSAATRAIGNSGERASQSTQSYRKLKSASSFPKACQRRSSMKALVGGSMTRRASTCRAVTATKSTGTPHAIRNAQARHPRRAPRRAFRLIVAPALPFASPNPTEREAWRPDAALSMHRWRTPTPSPAS